MLTLLATYFMTFAVYSFMGDSPHFLVLLDANGEPNFKTSCLSREQHCIGRYSIYVHMHVYIICMYIYIYYMYV